MVFSLIRLPNVANACYILEMLILTPWDGILVTCHGQDQAVCYRQFVIHEKLCRTQGQHCADLHLLSLVQICDGQFWDIVPFANPFSVLPIYRPYFCFRAFLLR